MTFPLETSPGAALDAMRMGRPLVHCITNYVAMNIAANTLLAAGASPAMIHAPEEAGEFAPIAAALTVNIGTLSPLWVEGIKLAAKAANAAGRCWVLDPVAHYATSYRSAVTRELLALSPTVIRGNASEILVLGGGESATRGIDSADPVAAAEQAARTLAARQACIVAVTGESDFVTDGTRALRIHGGSPLMPQVTALGCSLTCLVGAFTATGHDAFEATAAALTYYAVAGEIAAVEAKGPGSFGWLFLDALAALSPQDLDARARVEKA